MEITEQLRRTMDDLQIVPRMDHLTEICAGALRRLGKDEQSAPIWAEKLRYTYTKILEVSFPEYAAANGDVLPIDTSVPAAKETWEYFMIEQMGYADWIDDDGRVAPTGTMKASRHEGKCAEMGHRWDLTVFDVERAADAGVPLPKLKQSNAKRTHDAKTNWTWLFGDGGKNLPGLITHPNITVTKAPLNAGSTSRLWANKSVDEIAGDIALLVNTIADSTLEKYHAARVFMPPSLFRLLRDTRLGAGDGFASVLDWMRKRYEGDETGQGKVEFRMLNECDGARRLNPVTGTDDSGLSGDFLLALPPENTEELAFIRTRAFTQRPPQEIDLVLHHLTHSKIGGCKMQQPLSVHRMDFGTT